MKASRTRLSKLIADKSLKSGVSKKLAREVAAYLLQENRTNELDSILRDVQADWASAGYVEVVAASAHELTPQINKEITNQVKKLYPNARQIIVNQRHDPAVIGGVRLMLADQQLDLSVEAKLNKFKQLTKA